MLALLARQHDQRKAYRKGAVHNEEEAQDEEACSSSMCLLQLRQGIANRRLICAAQVWVGNGPEHQNTHKQKHSRAAQEANMTCKTQASSGRDLDLALHLLKPPLSRKQGKARWQSSSSDSSRACHQQAKGTFNMYQECQTGRLVCFHPVH